MSRKNVDHWTPPKETFLFKATSLLVVFLTGVVIHILLYVFSRSRFYGKDIIKREKGPYIFASNHTTMFDSGFIDGVLFCTRIFHGYRGIPYHTPEYGNFYTNSLLSWYMDHAKCIPLERGKGLDQPAQQIVSEKLKQGGIIHIFPEGTRSRTGELLPPKGGIGKRVYETRVKVIPCYQEGMRDILPVGTHIPRLGKKIRVIVGEPICFDEYFAKENVPDTWREIAQKVMDEIALLKEKLHNIDKKAC